MQEINGWPGAEAQMDRGGWAEIDEYESYTTCNTCALLYPKGSIHHCFTALWSQIQKLQEKLEEQLKPQIGGIQQHNQSPAQIAQVAQRLPDCVASDKKIQTLENLVQKLCSQVETQNKIIEDLNSKVEQLQQVQPKPLSQNSQVSLFQSLSSTGHSSSAPYNPAFRLPQAHLPYQQQNIALNGFRASTNLSEQGKQQYQYNDRLLNRPPPENPIPTLGGPQPASKPFSYNDDLEQKVNHASSQRFLHSQFQSRNDHFKQDVLDERDKVQDMMQVEMNYQMPKPYNGSLSASQSSHVSAFKHGIAFGGPPQRPNIEENKQSELRNGMSQYHPPKSVLINAGSKIPRVKEYAMEKLMERGYDKFTRKKTERGEELQSILMEYREQYPEHYEKYYMFTYFDLSEAPEDIQDKARVFFHTFTKGKDCIGSLNRYAQYGQPRFDGLLLLTKEVYEELKLEMAQRFDFLGMELLNDSNVTFRIHDKWGRPFQFILYD
ncbi:hypothetical protein FGO68_gene7356 [Halteria grandinella]|uniref:Uncharacterized protein n=1 Tax=Halteria grandinella TaxID=5974 RepID=A0A8J8NS60_HALGN|nr:hypothetical protein FGO68_gene7356 [Halteria grandinella]